MAIGNLGLGLTLEFPGSCMEHQGSLENVASGKCPIGKENSHPETDPGGNLLWLLDFKLDKLMPGEVGKVQETPKSHEEADRVRQRSPIDETAKKPPYTYTEMIEQALSEHGPLTVSDIYRWISDKFPYFRADDDKWKNSVRHNLSISPHFRKSTKSGKGAGHLWTLAIPGSKLTGAWQRRKTVHPTSKSSSQPLDPEKQNQMVDEAARACLELLRAEGLDQMETDEPVRNDSFLGRERPDSPITLDRATELLLGPEPPADEIPVALQPVEQRVEVEYLPHNDFDALCSAYDLDMHMFGFSDGYTYQDPQAPPEFFVGNQGGYQDMLFNDALCLGMSLEIL